MPRLLPTLALLCLLSSCTSEEVADLGRCTDGEVNSDSCADETGFVCTSATCVEGEWQCPADLFPTNGCRYRPDAGPDVCSEGQELTHACVDMEGSTCENAFCSDGHWECQPGFEIGSCPQQLGEDCSELGGGQAIVGERCNRDTVEYCIYSDTTQTATWSPIQSCADPQSCQELGEDACCQEAGSDTCMD